ncbi:alpha-glucosidase/alpha-galactosidase [Candidatus Parcubacteria bacterium]|nr:MAG: alpha-glucosidase/alpha-galactosidase [Candidatus Parcubacteria bacterium]
MIGSEFKTNNINIAYIGGGSKGWAWTFMTDLAIEENLSGTVKLYDIDYEAAYRNEIIGNSFLKRKEIKGYWKYYAVKTIEEALKEADFVIISILPGTLDEMEGDVHLPEKYGIYQSVGDTTGPGGIMRALRTIPIYMEFAQKVYKYCPDAWIINYTNPMAVCVRTLYHIYPKIKAFGCCHEVFSTQVLLAEMLKVLKNIENVNREEIKVNILGINHFTWIDSASYKNIDLLPLYKDFADKFYEEGYETEENEHWINNMFKCANKVKFDLFKRYGVIAAAGDRHLAEFMPSWYLKSPEGVEKWKFNLTPVEWRRKNKSELEKKSLRILNGEEELVLKPSGEEGVKIIKALLGQEDFITNVNIPNRGQLEGIPMDSVVETNAVFSYNSVKPVVAGRPDSPLINIMTRHVLNQETLLEAVIKKDKEIAFRAFINDPFVDMDVDRARNLFDEMLANNKKYLDKLFC